MDTEKLLRQVSAAPLGPLAVSYIGTAGDAWALTVTLVDRSTTIRAEREPKTEGLVLTCRIDTETEIPVHGSWVTKDEPIPGGAIERHLWIHGDGLNAALLLNALAELAHVAAAIPDESDALNGPALTLESWTQPEAVVEDTLAAEVPVGEASIQEPGTLGPPVAEAATAEPAPETAPVPRAKLLPWQSLGSVAPSKPDPLPEAVSEPAATETAEPAASTASPVDASKVGTPSAEPEPPIAGPTLQASPVAEEILTPEPSITSAVEPPTEDASLPLVSDTPQPAAPPPLSASVPALEGSPQPVGHTGTCRECGTPFAADHAFCTNCGIRLA
jgi:hypothetical protein